MPISVGEIREYINHFLFGNTSKQLTFCLALCVYSVSKLQYPNNVCVCAIAETCFLVDWKLLFKECIATIGIPLDIFGFLLFQWLFAFWIFLGGFGSLQTSLLCIMEELAGGGYVAVAVSVSERVSDSWKETRDMWHWTHDTWHMTQDTWVYSCHTIQLNFGKIFRD